MNITDNSIKQKILTDGNVSKPLVTIATPVYNAMPYLPDYLECLKQQTWRPLQVLIADDGSADGSAEVLRQAKSDLEEAGLDVQIVFREHAGQAAAMNCLIPMIEGSFFTWCDADDLLAPNSIEKKVCWLFEHPEDGMVRSNGIEYDVDQGRVIRQNARQKDRLRKDVFEELFTDTTYCYAGCYMLRTDLFFICYPDRQIPISAEGQNLQLLLPPASRSMCGYLDEYLHVYRRHEGSHSRLRRSFQDSLARLQNFTALRLEILKYCECDKEYFTRLAHQIEKEKTAQLRQEEAKKGGN